MDGGQIYGAMNAINSQNADETVNAQNSALQAQTKTMLNALQNQGVMGMLSAGKEGGQNLVKFATSQ